MTPSLVIELRHSIDPETAAFFSSLTEKLLATITEVQAAIQTASAAVTATNEKLDSISADIDGLQGQIATLTDLINANAEAVPQPVAEGVAALSRSVQALAAKAGAVDDKTPPQS